MADVCLCFKRNLVFAFSNLPTSLNVFLLSCAVLSIVSCVLSCCCCLAGALCALPALVLSIRAAQLANSDSAGRNCPVPLSAHPLNIPMNDLDDISETRCEAHDKVHTNRILQLNLNVRPLCETDSNFEINLPQFSQHIDDENNLRNNREDLNHLTEVQTNEKSCVHSTRNQKNSGRNSRSDRSVLIPQSLIQIRQTQNRASTFNRISESLPGLPNAHSRKLNLIRVKSFFLNFSWNIIFCTHLI